MVIPMCLQARPFDEALSLLEGVLKLTPAERSGLLGRQVVVKALESGPTREVGALGVARLNVPAEFFLQQYRDIVTFKQSQAVPEIGRFGKPPQSEDMKALTWVDPDIEALKGCRPGDCKVKLSSAMMQRLRGLTIWSSPDYRNRARSVIRDILAEYVVRYMQVGNSALIEYDDKERPVRLRDEFKGILAASRWLRELAPELYEYLLQFPEREPPAAENFLYWSKEKFGLKPVVSVTHVTTYRKVLDGRRWYFIASKQIYASHYFEASLGLTVLIDDPRGSESPGCWVVYLNRSRADGLQGFLSSLKRILVVRRLCSGMRRQIPVTRSRVEASYHGRTASRSVLRVEFGQEARGTSAIKPGAFFP
jgi:hypothetical protein